VRALAADEDLMMARLMPLFGKNVTMHHRVQPEDAVVMVDRLRQAPLRR
jgi:hypothetical protein